MADEAVKFGLTQDIKGITAKDPAEEKIHGVTVATVLNNIDLTGQARVQLTLPWLPTFTPWARLSSMMAGKERGSFFVPMIDDEVLVAFNHGDVREPYVLGSLWNTKDKPPTSNPTDARTRRKIRTPLGHELDFDDEKKSVTLSSNAGGNMPSTVTLDSNKAEISTPKAKVSVNQAGDVTIEAATKLTLKAKSIEIEATSSLKIQSNGTASLEAAGSCVVKGATVAIN